MIPQAGRTLALVVGPHLVLSSAAAEAQQLRQLDLQLLQLPEGCVQARAGACCGALLRMDPHDGVSPSAQIYTGQAGTPYISDLQYTLRGFIHSSIVAPDGGVARPMRHQMCCSCYSQPTASFSSSNEASLGNDLCKITSDVANRVSASAMNINSAQCAIK